MSAGRGWFTGAAEAKRTERRGKTIAAFILKRDLHSSIQAHFAALRKVVVATYNFYLLDFAQAEALEESGTSSYIYIQDTEDTLQTMDERHLCPAISLKFTALR